MNLNGIPLNEAEKFTYLGSMVRQDHGGSDRGITAKIAREGKGSFYLSESSMEVKTRRHKDYWLLQHKCQISTLIWL